MLASAGWVETATTVLLCVDRTGGRGGGGLPTIGNVPDAVAEFVIFFDFTSACVTAYEAAHVCTSPGASLDSGQLTTGVPPEPENSWVMTMPLSSTLPVLLTRNEYRTFSPAADTVDGDTDDTNPNPGDHPTAGWGTPG